MSNILLLAALMTLFIYLWFAIAIQGKVPNIEASYTNLFHSVFPFLPVRVRRVFVTKITEKNHCAKGYFLDNIVFYMELCSAKK